MNPNQASSQALRQRSSTIGAAGVRPTPIRIPAPAQLPRSDYTSDSDFRVRRLDSLARLLNYRVDKNDPNYSTTRPVVVAVAFRPLANTANSPHKYQLVIAHNGSSDVDIPAISGKINQRFQAIKEFIERSGSGVDDALNALELSSRYDRARGKTDLKKLYKTHRGGDSQRQGGQELAARLVDVFGQSASSAISNVTQKPSFPYKYATAHAEAAVAHFGRKLQPPIEKYIGVSKLSCADCYEFLRQHFHDIEVRGSHGMPFPKWQDLTGNIHPRTWDTQVHRYHGKQEPDDSGSDSD